MVFIGGRTLSAHSARPRKSKRTMDATALQTQDGEDVFSKSGAKLRIQNGGVGSDTIGSLRSYYGDAEDNVD